MLELIGLSRLHVGPIALRVADGECVSVMGASGAGKSVLLRMMADLDPHAGEMRLDGVAASAMPAPDWRAQVTYVAADAGWWAPRAQITGTRSSSTSAIALLRTVSMPSPPRSNRASCWD